MSDHNPFFHTAFNPEEDNRENELRPRFFKDFQGQESVKKNLQVFIDAARKRGDSLDHVFLSGPPGLGKTTLAGIMAHELGVEMKVTAAPALDKPKDLAGILTTLSDRSVLFIDEIHRLKPAIEEILYVAMEDFELDWIIGQGPSARTLRIPLPAFTLIGATTKPGNVAGPLLSRFGISVRINLYEPEELGSIIHRSSEILSVPVRNEAVEMLSRCSRGTPRIANRLLRRMRDFAEVEGSGTVDLKTVHHGLQRLEIDENGLERQDRRILKAIVDHYSGGPVGAETLAISVGESIETLEDFYEPFLIQSGYIQRTPRGRVATERAYRLIEREPKRDEDQQLLL
ncbi:MAG: Holliday junction branch migration DNA helicase RuvB [Spirochaetales bacterium]|nr:Holliday junction branch migration DNA helicase RuvB [Spirochaetales bacterium]